VALERHDGLILSKTCYGALHWPSSESARPNCGENGKLGSKESELNLVWSSSRGEQSLCPDHSVVVRVELEVKEPNSDLPGEEAKTGGK